MTTPKCADRGDRDEEQYGDVEVGDDRVRRERDDEPDERGRDEHGYGRPEEDPKVRAARRDVLFGKELEDVGGRLQQPAGADPIRPETEVDVARDLPLGHRKDGREVEHEEQHGPEGDEQPYRLDLEQVQDRLHLLVPPSRDGVDEAHNGHYVRQIMTWHDLLQ